MIGERIESRPALPVGALIMVFVALAFIALAVVFRSVHPALFAILPASVGIALLLTRPGRFSVGITSEGLTCESPPLDLAYEDIEGLVVHGSRRDPRGGFAICHRGGVLRACRRDFPYRATNSTDSCNPESLRPDPQK